MVVGEDGQPYLVDEGWLALWRPQGYGPRVAVSAGAVCPVLTPRSIVLAIAAGYPVEFGKIP